MDGLTAARAPTRAVLARPGLAIAAVSSIIAGMLHAVAARNHEGATLLVWMFALCAAAQCGWGAAVLLTPRRRAVAVGLVVNGGALLVWALTRTVGIPAIGSLAEVEAVGLPDLSAALFAGASVLGALWVLVRPAATGGLTLRGVGLIGALALVAALPGLSADHTHVHADGEGHDGHTHLEVASASGAGAHDHGGATEEHDHGSDAPHADHQGADHADHLNVGAGAAVHDHGDTTALANHDHVAIDPAHVHEHPTDPANPTDPHEHPTDPANPTDPHDPITSIDDPRLTEEQWNAAVALIISTTSGMRGFTTEEEVMAAGYESIGDGGEPGSYEHFINWSYLGDEFELDAAHIESIVMKMNADGTKRVVSGMYILTLGKTMEEVPPLAGELTTWHDHDNLCFEGAEFVAVASDGVCPLGVLVDTPPMLHVWVEANPCGPFAAIDEHGSDCGVTHTH